jgi:hypothetical protein
MTGRKKTDEGKDTTRRTPRESVDLARRPGPGERDDAEKPGARLDVEEQSGGRSLEEEMLIAPNDDDAGGLPNQQVANRGPQKQGKDREVPQTRHPLTEK